ncbi:MAG: hypothetical protein CMD27_03240 [Flavobacteriales bacterium]|nr:hypothetical protein [Flavobacteriales bacterium]
MRVYFFILISLIYLQNNAQNWGDISGNTELNIQTFQEDSTINAEARDAYVRNYINLIYNYKNISVGSRWELYNNTIPGLKDYEGAGLANKFVQFKNNFIDITLGNFYDEFGNGLIFRTYYDPNLGVDNSVNGLRLKTNPYQGIYLTAIIGRQKSYWELSNSTLRALNADLLLNEIILKSWSSYVNVGASFVTKKEYDDNPLYILPENVGAFNGRLHVTKNNININIDYAYKINDPSADNNYIYKDGNAIIITSNYSTKGLGVSLGLKRLENMSFRSERNAILQDLNINFITPFTKQQSYSLATIYPYTSQPNGEMGTQFDIYYTIPKKTKIGGKYGTSINLNFSNVFNIDRSLLSGSSIINESGTIGYNSSYFKRGEKLFQEMNIEISKKVNKKLKLIGSFICLENNDKIIKSQPLLDNQNHEYIYAKIAILEILYKIKPKNSVRIELQHLSTKQHYGNWIMGLIEYKLAPSWFWSIQDLYNYGHPNSPHYYSISSGYTKGANRLSMTYGKQRAGLFCVGGVCREVPASNGFSISLTSSF